MKKVYVLVNVRPGKAGTIVVLGVFDEYMEADARRRLARTAKDAFGYYSIMEPNHYAKGEYYEEARQAKIKEESDGKKESR